MKFWKWKERAADRMIARHKECVPLLLWADEHLYDTQPKDWPTISKIPTGDAWKELSKNLEKYCTCHIGPFEFDMYIDETCGPDEIKLLDKSGQLVGRIVNVGHKEGE